MIFLVVLILIFIMVFNFVPTIIKAFGNETFDEDKATGRTVRKTPAQKALRFKIYAAAVFALVFLISIIVIF